MKPSSTGDSQNDREYDLPILSLGDIPLNLYAGRKPIEHARFRDLVVSATRQRLPLRQAGSNGKMGGDVLLKGPWAGKLSFATALQEGITCPTNCLLRRTGLCGAANYSGYRFNVDTAFYDWAAWQIGTTCRRNADGMAVRLFVTGDFPDEQMVRFWRSQLEGHSTLCVWGHTHRNGALRHLILTELNEAFPERALIRISDTSDDVWRAVTVLDIAEAKQCGAVICPAGLTAGRDRPRVKRNGETPLSSCDRCGLCMNRRIRTIGFPLMINGRGYAEAEMAICGSRRELPASPGALRAPDGDLKGTEDEKDA